jgi:hypothetical protein
MNSSRILLKTIVAMLPLLIVGELQAAEQNFDPTLQPLGGMAPMVLKNTDMSIDGKSYRAWFENGAWQGDIIEYTTTTTGGLTTSVDLTGTSPVNTGSPPDNWSVHVQFAAAEAADIDYWRPSPQTNGRKIITHNGSGQIEFTWGNLTDTQKAALDQTAFDDVAISSRVLDFLRGDRSNENPTDGLRLRYSVMGDVIHSTPVYVGAPTAALTEPGYSAFAAGTAASRDDRVYVGANDGMLHAFDADDGNEAWAYVPSMLLGELDRLAGRPYSHHYTVDGLTAVQDVYASIPSGAKTWRTVLVGGLGAGGKGWYALDITDPVLADATLSTGSNLKSLWEIDASDSVGGDDLGYSYGKPVIAKLNDGNWYVVMGNGYGSVNAEAKLLIVNIATGVIFKSLSTGTGTTASPNGLSAAALIDTDGDGDVDAAYAGDLDGDLWKFDLSSTSPGSWGVAYGKPLYDGLTTQPITTRPDISSHPTVGNIVFFATGRLFTQELDHADTSIQAIYGIWDNRLTPPDTQPLLAQTLSGDKTYTSGTITETVQTFNPEIAIIDWTVKKGWKVELPAGYRVLQPPQLRASRFRASIHLPEGRKNYLAELNFLTGGSSGQPTFDVNIDNNIAVDDNVDGNADGDLLDREDFVTMWRQPDGVMSEVTIGSVTQGLDVQMLNYLVPPAGNPCHGDCSGGFQFGHVDVDTDYWDDADLGVGDGTQKHTHEYDKKAKRVYIDYRDFGADVTGHAEIDDTNFVPDDEEWIVVVANADLNPGATLTLDDVKYNVVDYQVMIHQLLRTWWGTNSVLEDAAGNSLIFTSAELVASGGTVKQAFDDLAILAGGLHPSNTSCVNKDDAVTNDRYRNGALVTQLISADVFAKNCNTPGCNLDPLIVQNPTDMGTTVQLGDNRQVTMKVDFDDSGTFDASNYEIFGGLRADISGQGDTDALWESTVFWHYGGGSCYGADGYDADVLTVRDEMILTQEEFDEMLAALGITDLDQALADKEFCKDTKEGKDLEDGTGRTGCKDSYDDILDLMELEQTIYNPDASDLESDLIGQTLGDPFIVGGDGEHIGPSPSSNYNLGRRTWTDITDE